ncbi:hypothetical protein TUSST3_01920 [Streptomyces sp. TUS-ST3]|nr:hypothetical protein TUSST3_01920 [Streptomyces sp. TUS-ST3]
MDEESESDDEQALRASSAAAPTPATCRLRRFRRAVRVITGPLPLGPDGHESLAARADPIPMIMTQMRGESLLWHRMSRICDLSGWHVRLYGRRSRVWHPVAGQPLTTRLLTTRLLTTRP